MIKYFKEAFIITNENIILTTPFILFLIILGSFIGLTIGLLTSPPSALLLILTLTAMFSAFFASWFYLIQKTIDIHYENKKLCKKGDIFIRSNDIEISEQNESNSEPYACEKKTLPVIKTMYLGVGEYFFPFLFGAFLFSGLAVLFVVVGKYAGNHFIGHLNISWEEFKQSMDSSEQLHLFLAGIPRGELIKLSKWNLLIASLISLFSFITLFWCPAVIKTVKNPLIAFFKSLKFLFKNFFGSFVLFVYITLINLFVTIINGLFSANSFLYFISTLIYFYFVVYIIVLVFLYYDEQQSEGEKQFEE